MAAYAALVSLMQIIHQIKHHPSPPISMEENLVDSLTEIVSSLQGFLEGGYNSPVADDSDGADPLEMRIADAAYAAEDVIESHIVDTIKLRMSTTARYEFRETSSCMRFDQDLRKVIKRMDVIKNEVMEKMVDVVRNEDSSSAASASSSAEMILESSIILDPSSTIMGFNEVLEKVAAEGDDIQVIPIVGMGGIGKTTLARNIYAHPFIKDMFDVRAWVKASDTKEILCEVLSQASGESKETLRKMSEADLELQLYQYLYGRRFLIVMDDMWSAEAWESTSRSFPNTGSGTRGRVVVTTRQSKVGNELNDQYSLKMRFLDEERSWELFSKTVFGVGEDRSSSLEVEKVGKKIVENCRGLPLSIVVVGGILRKMKQTKAIWEGVLDNLTSVVNLNNDKHCLKLLKTSYHFLPVHLKPCFLYMGLFEEDDEFYGPNLIKLWVSEGFVKPKDGESLETTAEEFLKELGERNLILVTKLGSRGNIQDFIVHDLLMDLCSREGQTQRFYHVVRPNRRRSRGNSSRRLLITDDASEKVALDALNSMPLVRSIICEDNDKVLACQKLGLLRILSEFTNHVDEDGTPLAFQFVNLRLLDVEVHNEFLSISHLWNLQTLIVNAYMELHVPAAIWRMPLLRHIEFVATRQRLPDPPSSSNVVMENLHTLKGVENLSFSQEVVEKLPNVKRLLIQYDHEVDSNMEGLSKLEFLTCLQEKWWKLHDPQNLTFPQLIKKLTLTTIYGDDTLQNIGALPLLEKLKLMSGSFKTGNWVIHEGQFPRLKFLKLIWCNGLKHWTTAEDASYVFPRLEQLYLSRLTQLMEIPCEIGKLLTLRSIELSFCNESAVRCVKQVHEEEEDCQEDSVFHVVAEVHKRHQELKSLASRNFKVEVFEIC